MLNLREIRDIIQAIPQMRQELETAITAISDLVPVEIVSFLVPDITPSGVTVEVSPVGPPPTVQSPAQPEHPTHVQPVHPAQPQEVIDAPVRSGGSYAYIPLDLHGTYPRRTKPQPPKMRRPPKPQPKYDASAISQAVLACLADGAKHFDVICETTQQPPGFVSASLVTLELTRQVKRLTGDRYAKQ